MKVLIIVPAFNEQDSIRKVIEELSLKLYSWDILVINDCSKDNTSIIAEETQKATVINLPCNLGIGGAVQTGFKYALRNHYDIAVQFDGDGQHIALEIPKLLEIIEHDKADLAIGSRFLNNDTTFKSTYSRRLGIRLFSIINSFLIGQKITDNTSGFRAANRKTIEFLSMYYPSDYPEPESIILLGKNHFRILEVPIDMRERQGGKSSINGLKSCYYVIKVLLAIMLTAIRPAR